MTYVDMGKYYLNCADQRTEEWLKSRKGRLTASNVGYACGYSKFCSPDEIADDITGIKKKNFTEEAIRVMNIGTITEPIAREWYCKNKKVIVKEYGVCVPKFNIYIAGSPDGVVFDNNGKELDGLIEIKCPEKMYQPLKEYMESISKGWKVPKYYNEHIWKTHVCQMMTCMAVLDKKWCDYIVYCPKEDLVFNDRLEFNETFWTNELYPKINWFIEEKLKPRMKKIGLEVENPEV